MCCVRGEKISFWTGEGRGNIVHEPIFRRFSVEDPDPAGPETFCLSGSERIIPDPDSNPDPKKQLQIHNAA
jgi:hypothetical protein